MIQANELRLGNMVLVYNQIVEVLGIDEDKIETSAYFYDGMGCTGGWLKEADPIILTPEILRECGFFKENNIHPEHWDMKDYKLTLSEVNDGFEVYASECTIGKAFKYLHQLQNVYYILTGEELEIDL